MTTNEHYIGDGLYASFDGFGFTLRAPRETGDHTVYLEPDVLASFIQYVEQIKKENETHHDLNP